MTATQIMKKTADTVRILSAEAIQKANSGHPGMPMGGADFATVLWHKHMRHNPHNPTWLNRDRFVLSTGHGSMLLYSLLHLYDYGLTIDDLKQFRQWGSLTPGHPEVGHTDGVDVTTGPLGSGFASAVGMSIAQKYFSAQTGLDKTELMDGKVYVIVGDGCMMEGTLSEAASLAGHLKLDNIVCFYDDNSITIEGGTDLAFTEDVAKRFEAYNWRVLNVDDANDIDKIDAALTDAKNSDGRPTLIVGKTKIGFGSPNKQGKASAHGEPLGEDEIKATKKNLGFPEDKDFYVPEDVREALTARVAELEKDAATWDTQFQAFLDGNKESAELIDKMMNKAVPENLLEELLAVAPTDKPVATRASGGAILQKVSELVPALYGGSADLSPSTKTDIKDGGSFTPECRSGKNLHFGVRELGMGFIANGMALQGTAIPYTSTFFVFSDYMKPAIRLASVQNLHEIYVFTHDSFCVGEDGPTHQPIEQLTMLRSIPGVTVIRPAEANEVAHAWNTAVRIGGPVVIALTRQNLAPLSPELAAKIDMSTGAYILSDDGDADMTLIATGSEVEMAIGAADKLREAGQKVRVVSMPSQDIFLAQSKEVQASIIDPKCPKRITIEAGSTFGWHRFVGDNGLCIGIDHFGASGPYALLQEKFGFTVDGIVAKIKENYAL